MRPFFIFQIAALAVAVMTAACSPRESSSAPPATGSTAPGASPSASAASR